MNTGEDAQGLRKIIDLTRLISLFILSVHFYLTCYQAFREWRWTAVFINRIIGNIAKTGLFNGMLKPKLAVLLFLIISVLYKLKNDDEMEKEKIEQLLNKNQDDVHTSKNISPDSTKQANNAQK